MGARKKGADRVREEEELSSRKLQAILLADSFTTKFRPATLQQPKVLLPLVNVPMISYTLAWLESAGVEEVFVFCCAHSKQIIEYLENSEWYSHPGFSVQTIVSTDSLNAGDALRIFYQQATIHGDFVLVSGDTVSNMPLADLIQEHKERKKEDNEAIMTMVIKQSEASPLTHQSSLGTNEIFMVVDPSTKQLLYYGDETDQNRGPICIDNSLLLNNPSISLHTDRQDCYIDICSPEVLSLFQEHFDYQHLRHDFVERVLDSTIMGCKIFVHEIHSSYVARIDNFRSYDTVSKDIIQRWTYPFVPDINFSGNRPIELRRQGVYRASDTTQSRSAEVGPFTMIGYGSKIGSGAKISNSVVGNGCSIGSNVLIEGSYIWNNVTIEDGCVIKHAVICDGVMIKAGAILQPGVVLSFKVVIGQNFVVPAYSKVSLLQKPTKEHSDKKLGYADNSSGIADLSCLTKLNIQMAFDVPDRTSELGPGGAGHIWEACEGAHEEWKYSVAPIPKEKLAEITQATVEDEDMLAQDDGVLPPGELKSDEDSLADYGYSNDDYSIFESEVEATFVRAVHENVEVEHVLLEVNSLRLSFNMETADCAAAVFYSVIKAAMDMPRNSASELKRNAENVITTWKRLVHFYVQEIDEQIEVIMKFEEMCEEYAKEFSPLFTQILHFLYEKDVIEENAILRWAEEKAGADECDKFFLKQADKFIQWLKEAEEEDEDED